MRTKVRKKSLADLEQHWWSIGLRGATALTAGLVLMLWLTKDTRLLFDVFGAYMFIDGLLEIGAVLREASRPERWWQALISGAVSAILGLSTLAGRGLSPADRVMMIAARSCVSGIAAIVNAHALQVDPLTKGLLYAGGIGGVCLGILLIVIRIGVQTTMIIRLVGVFTVLLGLLLGCVALRLRNPGSIAPFPGRA